MTTHDRDDPRHDHSGNDTMNIDDNIPDDDATAAAARNALHQLGGVQPVDLSWADVQGRARRVKQRRLSAMGAACAVVLIGTAVAVAGAAGNDEPARIANGVQASTTTSADGSTTTLSYSSSSAATTFPGNSSSAPPLTGGPGIVLPDLPSTSPLPGDFSGSLTLRSAILGTEPTEVGTGDEVEIDAIINNISNREVWASSSSVPTSVATICSSDSASSGQTLWWMTNISMAPGDTDGRTGTFTPTAAYAGTVTCEVVIVTTNQQGTEFDQSAGGDAATATVLWRVDGIPPLTFSVSTPTTTSVPDTSTTVPETTTTLTTP
jgi:hypothetical protein